MFQATRRFGSVLTRLLRRGGADGEEEREAELHLYVVSQTSRLYLQLHSSWNSFLMVGGGRLSGSGSGSGNIKLFVCLEVHSAAGSTLQEEVRRFIRLNQVTKLHESKL